MNRMADFGFILTRLTVTGPNVPAADVQFRRGLNVVAGPSDTGKTFIAQCIDFAMGAGDPPKEIPEAARYDRIALELEANADSKRFILERGLRGGDVRLQDAAGTHRVLRAKHDPNAVDNVSSFLLQLSGLHNKRVRTNERGETRAVSFRDLARLVLVDEEVVFTAESPVLSGQYTSSTVDSSVFRLL